MDNHDMPPEGAMPPPSTLPDQRQQYMMSPPNQQQQYTMSPQGIPAGQSIAFDPAYSMPLQGPSAQGVTSAPSQTMTDQMAPTSLDQQQIYGHPSFASMPPEQPGYSQQYFNQNMMGQHPILYGNSPTAIAPAWRSSQEFTPSQSEAQGYGVLVSQQHSVGNAPSNGNIESSPYALLAAAIDTRQNVASTPPQASSSRTLSIDSAISNARTATNREPPVPLPRMGPTTSDVTVPARPKPGRKPMPPDRASDRRRTQNRMAQRNFRDKRTQKVHELTDEIAALKDSVRTLEADFQRQMDAAKQENQRQLEALKQENRILEASNDSLEERLREANARAERAEQLLRDNGLSFAQAKLDFSNVKLPTISNQAQDRPGEIAIPTPPEDNYNEIDMQEVWTRGNKPTHPRSNWPEYDMDTDSMNPGDGCGFCTDESNCACKAAAPPVPSKQSSGPGTCDMCQQDPARAEACRTLANKTQPSVASSHETSSSNKTMSCGQFIDKFNTSTGRMPSIAELLGPLHSFPASNGFNVDEREAAEVLHGMAKQ